MTAPLRLALPLTLAVGLAAADYFADPAVTAGGSGSRADPWPALQRCIADGRLARLRPGDTLHLLGGAHGAAEIAGNDTEGITIAGIPGQDVRLSRLSLDGAVKWRLANLRISPAFGEPYVGWIVSLGDRGEGRESVIDGCEVFAVDDHAGLDVKRWMGLNSGILLGRNASGGRVRDCLIRNVRFALTMSAVAGVAEGNMIENYSADGIRMTRDDQIAEHNVIKGAFAGADDGDPNHDDGIQCFLHNRGTGTVRNLTVRGNLLQGHAPGSQPLAAINQGIGFFDGPLIGFRIEGNVVMVSHHHGIALFDAQGCTISDNVTYSTFGGRLLPWVMLGEKLGQAKGNTVTGNLAHSFNLDQPGTIAERNLPVTEALYRKALADLSARLCERYGEYHRTSRRHRITGQRIERLPEEVAAAEAKRPVKPATAPLPGLRAKEGELDRRLAELRSRLDARLDAGTAVRFHHGLFREEVAVTAREGNQYRITVPKVGSSMLVPLFLRLDLADAARLSAALTTEHDTVGHALTAFLHLAGNDRAAAQPHLARAGDQRQAVTEAFVTSGE